MPTHRLSEIPEPIQHPTFDALPNCPAFAELTAIPHWVAWKLDYGRGGEKPTKVPVSPRTGFNASSTNPQSWGTYQEACERAKRSRLEGVGFVLTEEDDFTGIDLDACYDLDLDLWSEIARTVIGFGETYAETSPSGTGLRLWVRGRIEKSIKAPGIELYTSKRYLTVTGWHVAGTPGNINPAPKTLAYLQSMMPAKEAPSPFRPSIQPSHGLSPYVAQALANECARLAGAPDGAVNNTANEAAFNIGQLVPHGLSEGEALAALEDAARAAGATASRYWGPNGTIARGLRAGMEKPREIPEREERDIDHEGIRAILRHADGTYTTEDGEIIEARGPAIASSVPPEFTSAPGLVGEIARWIVATAERPQPLLAIGAALSIVGTVAGGKYCGPTRSATHLYILTIAPTGAGKDTPLKAIRRLLDAAKMQDLVGPDEFTSMPAVNALLQRTPVTVCPMDEFGSFLKRINSKKAQGFEAATSKVFRTAWGCSFSDMVTPEYAKCASVRISNPGMSIVGATTAEEFYQSIAAGDSANGVLNRFLLLETSQRPPRRKPELNPYSPPQRIINDLTAIHKAGAAVPGEGHGLPEFEGINAVPVLWGPEAETIYEGLIAKIEAKADQEDPHINFYGRTAEMAVRIATILAIGRKPGTRNLTLLAEDMDWAARLAWWSAETMIVGVREHASENEHQANYKLVRNVIEKAGMVRRMDLLRKIQGRIDARSLDGIMKSLLEAGEIEADLIKPSQKGGRPTTIYRVAAPE